MSNELVVLTSAGWHRRYLLVQGRTDWESRGEVWVEMVGGMGDGGARPALLGIPGGGSGANVPVISIFENLKTSPIEEILENFHVTREQVHTVLDFVAKSASGQREVVPSS